MASPEGPFDDVDSEGLIETLFPKELMELMEDDSQSSDGLIETLFPEELMELMENDPQSDINSATFDRNDCSNVQSSAEDALTNQDAPQDPNEEHDLPTELQTDQFYRQQLRVFPKYHHLPSAPNPYQSEDALNQQQKENLNPVDQAEFNNLIATVGRLSLEQTNHLFGVTNQRKNDLERENFEREKVGQPFPNISKHKGGSKKPRIDRKRKHGAKEIVAEPKSLGTFESAKLYEKYLHVYELPDRIKELSLNKKNLDAFRNSDVFKEVEKMIDDDPYKEEYLKYQHPLMRFMIFIWAWMPLLCKLKEILIEKGIHENEFPCYQYDGLIYWNDTYSRKVRDPNLKRQEARRKIEGILKLNFFTFGDVKNGNNEELERALNEFWSWDNALFKEFKTRVINTKDSKKCRERKKAKTNKPTDNLSHERQSYLVHSLTSGSETMHSPVSYIE